MAEKSSGKSQGRSRPQAQSKNQGRSATQKQNPDSSRGGGGRGAANGTAARKSRGESQSQSQAKGRGREAGDQSEKREAQGQDESQSSGGGGGKVAEQLKQHPITTAALGAGLTLLAAQGLRLAINAKNQSAGDDSGDESGGQEGEGEQEDDELGASASGEEDQDEGGEQDEEGDEEGDGGESGGVLGRLGRVGSKFGQAFRGSGQAISRGARSGFDRGREGAQQSWVSHPLFMCGVALAAGAAAGFLIPSTRQEDRLMGKTSDKVAGRFKKGGQVAFRQGRDIAGKVLNEAVTSASREAEREGLTPDRLGKKFKRVFSNVRDAVAEAVQED